MSNLTIAVDDQLIKMARIRAISEGTSVSAKVREFLAQYAHAATQAAPPPMPVFLPVYSGGGGLRPGINPSSNKSMLDAADGFLDGTQ